MAGVVSSCFGSDGPSRLGNGTEPDMLAVERPGADCEAEGESEGERGCLLRSIDSSKSSGSSSIRDIVSCVRRDAVWLVLL